MIMFSTNGNDINDNMQTAVTFVPVLLIAVVVRRIKVELVFML